MPATTAIRKRKQAYRNAVFVDVNNIRYTQTSVKDTFSNGAPLSWTIYMLKTGQIKPRELPLIRIGCINNQWRTIDNRRLYCFKTSGITQIPAIIMNNMTYEFVYKNQSYNDGKTINLIHDPPINIDHNQMIMAYDPQTSECKRWKIITVIQQTKQLNLISSNSSYPDNCNNINVNVNPHNKLKDDTSSENNDDHKIQKNIDTQQQQHQHQHTQQPPQNKQITKPTLRHQSLSHPYPLPSSSSSATNIYNVNDKTLYNTYSHPVPHSHSHSHQHSQSHSHHNHSHNMSPHPVSHPHPCSTLSQQPTSWPYYGHASPPNNNNNNMNLHHHRSYPTHHHHQQRQQQQQQQQQRSHHQLNLHPQPHSHSSVSSHSSHLPSMQMQSHSHSNHVPLHSANPFMQNHKEVAIRRYHSDSKLLKMKKTLMVSMDNMNNKTAHRSQLDILRDINDDDIDNEDSVPFQYLDNDDNNHTMICLDNINNLCLNENLNLNPNPIANPISDPQIDHDQTNNKIDEKYVKNHIFSVLNELQQKYASHHPLFLNVLEQYIQENKK